MGKGTILPPYVPIGDLVEIFVKRGGEAVREELEREVNRAEEQADFRRELKSEFPGFFGRKGRERVDRGKLPEVSFD